MKLNQNSENYIKKEELESLYNYQKRSFDSQLSELNKNIDEIREFISVRFGEDISNNKYEKEIDNLKKEIDKFDTNHKEQIEGIKKDIETNLEGLVNETLESARDDLNSKLKEIETKAIEIQEEIENGRDTFIEQLEKIDQEGRSRTLISKFEKKVSNIYNEIDVWKSENYQSIEDLDNSIQNLNQKLSKDIEEKIQNLDYQNTIFNINENIKDSTNLLETKQKEIENSLKDEFNSKLLNKLDTEEYKTKTKELNENIDSVNNQITELKEVISNNEKNNLEELKKFEENTKQDIKNRVTIEEYDNNIKKINEEIVLLHDSINKNNEIYLNNIKDVETKLANKIDEKIEKLDLQNTVEEIKKNIDNLQKIVIYNKQTISKQLENLEESTVKLINEKVQALEFTNTIHNIEESISKIDNRINDMDYQNNVNKIKRLEEKIEILEKENKELQNKIDSTHSQIDIIQKNKKIETNPNKQKVLKQEKLKADKTKENNQKNKKDLIYLEKIENTNAELFNKARNSFIGIYNKTKQVAEKQVAKGITNYKRQNSKNKDGSNGNIYTINNITVNTDDILKEINNIKMETQNITDSIEENKNLKKSIIETNEMVKLDNIKEQPIVKNENKNQILFGNMNEED